MDTFIHVRIYHTQGARSVCKSAMPSWKKSWGYSSQPVSRRSWTKFYLWKIVTIYQANVCVIHDVSGLLYSCHCKALLCCTPHPSKMEGVCAQEKWDHSTVPRKRAKKSNSKASCSSTGLAITLSLCIFVCRLANGRCQMLVLNCWRESCQTLSWKNSQFSSHLPRYIYVISDVHETDWWASTLDCQHVRALSLSRVRGSHQWVLWEQYPLPVHLPSDSPMNPLLVHMQYYFSFIEWNFDWHLDVDEIRPASDRWRDRGDPMSPQLVEDPLELRERDLFVGQHDPVMEQEDPFIGQDDDEQSELSFSSAFGTPATTPHLLTHHHRETTVWSTTTIHFIGADYSLPIGWCVFMLFFVPLFRVWQIGWLSAGVPL